MFAFALWDRQQRALCLVRDRLGEKPLYYGWMGSVFMFGSELKALRVHPAFKVDIDRNAVALYLRHNYIPAPYSIYQGIHKLPPGMMLRVGHGRAHGDEVPEAYWSVRGAAESGLANPFTGDEIEATNELDALLRDAVGLRMEADVPLGAFLSGGIDSSTVVALMRAQSAQPVRTFTIGFFEQGYNEARYASQVAKHLGTDHTELYVRPEEAMAVIPRLPTIYDEPFSDSSQIPTCIISALARRYVTVCLSGDGGDELFAGYNRYALARRVWGGIRLIPSSMRGLAARAVTSMSPNTWNSLLAQLERVMPSKFQASTLGDRFRTFAEIVAVPSPDMFYRRLVSHWKHPESVVVGGVEPQTAFTDSGHRLMFPDLTHRMMYLDSVAYLPDDILVKVDRASMAVGLEARVPLIDHRVVEFSWRLPLSMKVRMGGGKHILKRVLSRYVPSELVERPKTGFGIPLAEWLRGPLREWADDLLVEKTLRDEGFFDPQPIRTMWTEHLSGRRDRQYYLWDVLMFEAWLQGQRVS
jgi:asparagine synthase (glutamine-hydrolysing)